MLHFFDQWLDCWQIMANIKNEKVKCINNYPVTINDYKQRHLIFHTWIIDCKEICDFNWLWIKLKTHSPAGKIYQWIPKKKSCPNPIFGIQYFWVFQIPFHPIFQSMDIPKHMFFVPFPVSHPFCHFAIAWRPLLPARSLPPASHRSAKILGSHRW